MRNNEPSGVNFVSLLLLIAVIGAGYWGWKFFPHYWNGWQVDHVLQDGAMKTYKIQRLAEPFRSQARQALVDEMRNRIVVVCCKPVGHIHAQYRCLMSTGP